MVVGVSSGGRGSGVLSFCVCVLALFAVLLLVFGAFFLSWLCAGGCGFVRMRVVRSMVRRYGGRAPLTLPRLIERACLRLGCVSDRLRARGVLRPIRRAVGRAAFC